MINKHSWLISDLDSIPKNNIKVFSTFSCGGGSSYGYELNGCEVIAANDIDPEMAYHYKLNHNPKYYYLCPIKDLLTKDLPDELYGIDICEGSPPCSTFSMAGNREKDWGKEKHFREGQSKQILDDLFFDYLDLIERLKPKVSIAENVKGLIQGNAKWYVKLIFNRYREIGYTPQLFLINAADCGVPQKRERVFFCAIRNDLFKQKLILNPSEKWVSAGEATSDLQELTDDEIRETLPSKRDLKWWEKTKPGDSYSIAIKRAENRTSCFNTVRLNGNEPACTLPSVCDQIQHWSELRRLTFREWKRLGSFPDDYKAKSDKIGKYMIGMSVPPKMMQYVSGEVIKQWLIN